jgi:hypothetical protein
MSFLDCNGALIPYSYEAWKDENKEGRERISKDAAAQSMYLRSFSSEIRATPPNISNSLKLRLTDKTHMFALCMHFVLNVVPVLEHRYLRTVYISYLFK